MKKNIEDTVQDVFDKMAEVYRDCDEQKKRILTSMKVRQNSWDAQDIEDKATLAKADNDDKKLLDNLISHKVKLATLQARLVVPTIKSETPEEAAKSGSLTGDMMKSLREIAKEDYKKEIKYNLE